MHREGDSGSRKLVKVRGFRELHCKFILHSQLFNTELSLLIKFNEVYTVFIITAEFCEKKNNTNNE